MKAVLKLGGFTFDPELSARSISNYARVIKEFSRRNRLAVVTGGGYLARKYIAAARELGASESACDHIGIRVSRLNAKLLVTGLEGFAFPEIPESLDDFERFMPCGLIIVMGGLQPGQSTNAVAALTAETMHADIMVNATDVDGVYDADPHKDPRATKLDQVTPDELSRILSSEGFQAGEYELMDPLAIRIIKRSKIPAIITDGRDPRNIDRALHGKRVGTRISSSEKKVR